MRYVVLMLLIILGYDLLDSYLRYKRDLEKKKIEREDWHEK